MSNKKSSDINPFIAGKQMPNASDLERCVLKTIIEYPNTLLDVKDILKPNDFYKDENKSIYQAILRVEQYGLPDLILVAKELKESGELDNIGGVVSLINLTNLAANVLNIKKYCAVIKEKSIQRKLIEFSSTILNKSFDETEDIFSTLEEAKSKIENVNLELSSMNLTQIDTVAMNVLNEFDTRVHKAKNNIIDENDIYTGLTDWDKINGRLTNGLYIIAGRPGMGKGIHMTELCCSMGKQFPIGVINGEMTDEQLLKRIGCNLMGINNFLFKKNPKLITEDEQAKLHEAMNEAINLKLHLDNNRYIDKIENKIRLWVEKFGVKCILADFLTLFKVPEHLQRIYVTDVQKINYVLDRFAIICKEVKIPIILYVQMNREILGRHGVKEPNLADLKQSGSIEELAFQVSFLHRPEYYDEKELIDENGENAKDLCYQIIKKHREGEHGRIKYKINMPCSQLKSWDMGDNVKFDNDAISEMKF